MLAAIIYMLTYVLGSFSSRSGAMSLNVVVWSLLYFFGSTIFLVMGVRWLSDLARQHAYFLNIGASALSLNALLHVACGFLTVSMYLKGQVSQGLTLQQVLNGIRRRKRSKSKH